MIDAVKFYQRLDVLDPRINPFPQHFSGDQLEVLLRRNLHAAECLKSVLVDDPQNILAVKAVGVINAIQESRGKI